MNNDIDRKVKVFIQLTTNMGQYCFLHLCRHHQPNKSWAKSAHGYRALPIISYHNWKCHSNVYSYNRVSTSQFDRYPALTLKLVTNTTAFVWLSISIYVCVCVMCHLAAPRPPSSVARHQSNILEITFQQLHSLTPHPTPIHIDNKIHHSLYHLLLLLLLSLSRLWS